MADGIKIGNLDISAFKVGSSDCKVYLGDVKVYPPTPSHDYVEIGGVKWATMNVGANSITDTGLYFSWGDISGYTASQVGSGSGQKYFGWADYKYGNGTSYPGDTGMTKYNSSDGKTVLEASDDAATTNWGGSWRMPTSGEMQSLIDNTTTAWTIDYQGSGVSGLVCTDKTDSSKVLFFPICGYCENGMVNNVDNSGYYWFSSLEKYASRASCLYFFDGYVTSKYYNNRCNGLLVRGVLG